MKAFRIFRPGSHVASCGTRVEFTEDDLKAAVAAYNAQVYAAPLVIGHPKTEDRAYGWAERLTYEDGHVVAHPEKVEPAFAALVEEGAYRNRSASWYMPNHPSNPVPGVLYPKHIGFLGAVPPSLKGLGDVAFQEGQAPVEFLAEEHPDQVVDFADSSSMGYSMARVLGSMAGMLRRLRDLRIEEKGLEDADRLIPDYVITDAEAEAQSLRNAASAQVSPAFTETTRTEEPTMTPEQIAAMQAENAAQAARLASFTERETAIAAAERLASVDSIARELEPVVAQGRLLPAQRKPLAEFMADLPDAPANATIEFGEAVEGVVPKVTPRAFLLGFLKGLPVAVDFRERGGAAPNAGGGSMTSTQLAALATKVRERVKKEEGREISFTEATNMALAESGHTLEAAPTAATGTE